MSRRKRRAGTPSGRAASGADPARRAADGGPTSGAAGRRAAVDVALLTAFFAITVGVAELAGAANLGVALGIGQVAFAIALLVLLLRA